MKLSYITLFPNFYNEFRNTSIIKKAIDNKFIEMNFIDFKDFVDKGRVDDKIVGGGKGNLIRYDVALRAINSVRTHKSKVILLTPKGEVFNQKIANKLSKEEELIFVCSHFEGIDERISKEVDYELSLGDYIISGGELASQVISDSIIRLVEGVINKESLYEESFNDCLLEYSQYTLPREYNNEKIPDIYFSGNHSAIEEYKLKDSLVTTKIRRPDLYKKHTLSEKEKEVLKKCNKKWIDEIVKKSKKS